MTALKELNEILAEKNLVLVSTSPNESNTDTAEQNARALLESVKRLEFED